MPQQGQGLPPKLEDTGLSALLVAEQHGEDGAQICPWTGTQDLWKWSPSPTCPPSLMASIAQITAAAVRTLHSKLGGWGMGATWGRSWPTNPEWLQSLLCFHCGQAQLQLTAHLCKNS